MKYIIYSLHMLIKLLFVTLLYQLSDTIVLTAPHIENRPIVEYIGNTIRGFELSL